MRAWVGALHSDEHTAGSAAGAKPFPKRRPNLEVQRGVERPCGDGHGAQVVPQRPAVVETDALEGALAAVGRVGRQLAVDFPWGRAGRQLV